jgi:L-threonylcarbamoyladenylate synthase
MSIERIDPAAPDPRLIARAAELLRHGGLVAFPTETVYGLGANALDPAAVERIYLAKGRPSYNPLIVHVAEISQVGEVASEWPDAAAALAAAFWPGPLTMVLPKTNRVPDNVSAGLQTVGVRIPRHSVAHALLAAAGVPIAAPSANRSMQVSPTTGMHVFKSLGDAVDLILDAGATSVGIESTVIDLSGSQPVLLRPGTITLPELEAVIGPVMRATAESDESARRSPGMLDKHYSPRAALVLCDAADVADRVKQARAGSQRVVAMIVAAGVDPAPNIVRMPDDALAYAARLYDTLHTLDDAGYDVIVVERVPNTPAWLGIRDRLDRAAR